MFLGTYYTAFSGKGRIILPKKFRSQLSKPEIILMKGFDGGIWGFSEDEWRNLSGKQLAVSLMDKKGRILRRKFFPLAEVTELDSQGRFVVSEFLLKESRIKTDLVLIGAGDHFEIWDSNLWSKMAEKGGE